MRQSTKGNIQIFVKTPAFSCSEAPTRMKSAMIYERFCGGIFETNCYLLKASGGWILFDAPDGACEWVRSLGVDLELLLLTHGHVDHVQDVARIKRQFDCPIGCHPLTAPMISDREFFRSFGFQLEIEPAQPDFLIEETPTRDFLGSQFQVLEVPGHCPGSLCFFLPDDRLLIGGGGLFAGRTGPGALPRGGIDVLIQEQSGRKSFLVDDVGHVPP